MYSEAVVCIFLIFSLRRVAKCGEVRNMCPRQDPAVTKPVFTTRHSTVVRECHSRSTRIACCMSGVSSIKWQQQSKEDDNKWIDVYDVPSSERKLDEKNQTLWIYQVDKSHDEGIYRCLGYNGADYHINSSISLTIFDCGPKGVPEALKPYRLSDKNPKTVYRRLPGQSVNISCLGNFGDVSECHYECAISWYFTNSTGYRSRWNIYEENKLNNTHPERVYVVEREQTSRVLMEQILIISEIRKSDYGLYTCRLSNPSGQVAVNLTLVEGEEHPKNDDKYLQPLIIVITVVIVMFLIIMLICYKRYEIRLRWKDHCGKRIEGDKNYDLFILYDDESDFDSSVVQDHLLPVLRSELQYRVCILPENHEIMNHPIQSLYDQANESSHRLVAIMSEDFVNSNVLKTCLLDASTAKYRNLIFVTYKGFDDCVSQLADGIQVAYRIAHKVQWPVNDNASDKERAKFWVKFRLRLPPKPKGDTSKQVMNRDRVESAASHKPLITSSSDEAFGGIVLNNSNQRLSSKDTEPCEPPAMSVRLDSSQGSMSDCTLEPQRGLEMLPDSPLEDNVFKMNPGNLQYSQEKPRMDTMLSDDSGFGKSVSV